MKHETQYQSGWYSNDVKEMDYDWGKSVYTSSLLLRATSPSDNGAITVSFLANIGLDVIHHSVSTPAAAAAGLRRTKEKSRRIVCLQKHVWENVRGRGGWWVCWSYHWTALH